MSSSGNDVSLRTGPIDESQSSRIGQVVNSAVDGGARQSSNELIGPSLSSELRRNAVIGLAIAVAAQLGYLAVRFDWRLGVATVAALLSDVLVLVGVFAWMGKTADGVFLAALLTVIGYSVNDSVVVFDRLRELRGSRLKAAYPDVVSDAVVQTVPRTVNTGIGVLFVLAALLVLGDGSLAELRHGAADRPGRGHPVHSGHRRPRGDLAGVALAASSSFEEASGGGARLAFCA